jgi:hypothetical protein
MIQYAKKLIVHKTLVTPEINRNARMAIVVPPNVRSHRRAPNDAREARGSRARPSGLHCWAAFFSMPRSIDTARDQCRKPDTGSGALL